MTISALTRPATADHSRSAHLFNAVHALLAEALQRRHIRRIYGRMSNRQLRDLGLTWQDIVTALALPLRVSASDAIKRAATDEPSQWWSAR